MTRGTLLHHMHSQLLFHNHALLYPGYIAASYFNFVLTHCHQFFRNITRPAKMKHLQCKGYITQSHRHTSITDNEDRLLHNSAPSCSSSTTCYNTTAEDGNIGFLFTSLGSVLLFCSYSRNSAVHLRIRAANVGSFLNHILTLHG